MTGLKAPPADTAGRIRDHLCVLANALEAIRLSERDESSVATCLRLAERQVEAIARLTDLLHEPATVRAGGEVL